MRVVNIITGFDNGGGGEYVLNICRSNIFVSNLICIGKGPLFYKAKNEGINTISLKTSEIIGKALEKYVDDNKIDIILWHGAKAFFLHSLVTEKIKRKSLATVHSDFRTDFTNNKIKKILYTKLSYIGLKSFKTYIAVSTVIKDMLNENFSNEKVYIARNSIDENIFKDVFDITRENFAIDNNDFLFVNVARLHPVKNQITLLKGFKKLICKYKNCKIIIVGDGSERNVLKNYIVENNLQDFVFMVGEKENAYKYINIGDANILSSISEGGEPPIVILEGAILRKPTLCSDIGFLKNIINNKMGYTFNPYDEDEIFKAMEFCINDINRLEKVENFREYVELNHSMKSFYNQYYKIFEECIKKGS